MPTASIRKTRRERLITDLGCPVLLVGNGNRARNLAMSPLPFRQDSSFLYFTGCTVPGAAALITPEGEQLYLPAPSPDDPLWHGSQPTIEEQARALGFEQAASLANLESDCKRVNGEILSLAVPDDRQTALARRLTGQALDFDQGRGPTGLIEAIIRMRRILSEDELQAMRDAAKVTAKAHRWAMAVTRPGVHEAELAALFDAIVAASGLTNAYESIVTVRGEVLHNFHRVNRLQSGQLMLLDGGAEARSGHATDVTRTWPVSGKFEPRQKAAYEAVLEAQRQAIERVRPGVRYREVHHRASIVLAQFLVDEGLVRGSAEAAVETGVHALFFPHGVGHLIGLDVHDLENFGDRAAYPSDRTRSKQFGTCYLRLDLDLEPGMAVTIEPGFYVVPNILQDRELVGRFGDQLDLERARSWEGFGGIRIEDDIAVSDAGPDLLTPGIPKTVDEVEAIVGTEDLGPLVALQGML
jgi:Xaa-Pro aminopeptidase